MKNGSRLFKKCMLVILLIAVCSFAVLSIQNRKAKEPTVERPSSYLSGQRENDIDREELKKITGDYQAVESGEEGKQTYVAPWWHLFISEEYEEMGPYFSVYDNNAGNPGFEGRIMYLKDGILIVEIDDDLFEEMPANWRTEEGGKYAILDYAETDEGIRLGYRDSDAFFVKD